MDHMELIDKLKAQLKEPLPGEAAHALVAPFKRKVAPFKRKSAKELMASNHDARLSAVLCLIYPINKRSHFVLIKRPVYDGAHSGQISFPGGKHEANETLQQTALREAHEEVGVQPTAVDIIAQLSPIYVPPSNFLISPFIGVVNQRPQFNVDKREVEYLLEIELKDLIKEDIVKEKMLHIDTKESGNMSFQAPYFDLLKETVWGATAAMLSELREILLRV